MANLKHCIWKIYISSGKETLLLFAYSLHIVWKMDNKSLMFLRTSSNVILSRISQLSWLRRLRSHKSAVTRVRAWFGKCIEISTFRDKNVSRYWPCISTFFEAELAVTSCTYLPISIANENERLVRRSFQGARVALSRRSNLRLLRKRDRYREATAASTIDSLAWYAPYANTAPRFGLHL